MSSGRRGRRRKPNRGANASRPAHRKARLPHYDAELGRCRFCGERVEDGPTGRQRNWHDGRDDEPNCVLDWRAYYDPRTARRLLIQRDGNHCQGCRHHPFDLVDGEPWGGKLEVDHVVPLIDGGGFELDNLQLLCTKCHKSKTSSENSARAASKEARPPVE